MFQQTWDTLQPVLGLGEEPKNLGLSQLILRGTIVFIAALIIVRVAKKRFMANRTAFDYVLGIILASMLARAINGSAPFFGTIFLGFSTDDSKDFSSHRLGAAKEKNDNSSSSDSDQPK